jgi:hypothetical protein
MTLGQAAGTAAALAQKEGVCLRDVESKELRSALTADGVIL